MTATQLLPWIAALGGWGTAIYALVKLFLIDRGRLRIDQTAAGAKLLTEHAERMHARNAELEPFRDAEFHRRECCRVVIALLRASLWGDWITAERDAVAMIRREGMGGELVGLDLASDMEGKL